MAAAKTFVLVLSPVPVAICVSFYPPFFHTLPQMKQSRLILKADASSLLVDVRTVTNVIYMNMIQIQIVFADISQET